MTETLLSIGHGFTAREFGAYVQNHGWRVIGTTRSEAKAQQLSDIGVEPIVWPGHDLGDAIKQATHILVSASPDANGDAFFNAYHSQLAASDSLKWIGYLSTTGVYGDHGGAWVDETTPVVPSTKRGQHRVKAEHQWLQSGLPVHVFRLAGIYGAGRGPFEKLRNGTARLVKKESGYLLWKALGQVVSPCLRSCIVENGRTRRCDALGGSRRPGSRGRGTGRQRRHVHGLGAPSPLGRVRCRQQQGRRLCGHYVWLRR